MKQFLLAAAVLFAGLGLASQASAIDFTVSGAILTVTYTEPAVNTDNTPLDDLDHTNVYVQVDSGAETKGANILATSVKGGGAITTQVTVPVVVGQKVNVTISASATDITGNESARSIPVTKRIDRLAPTAPK